MFRINRKTIFVIMFGLTLSFAPSGIIGATDEIQDNSCSPSPNITETTNSEPTNSEINCDTAVSSTDKTCQIVELDNQELLQDSTDNVCDSIIDQPPTDEPEDVGVVDNPDITNTNKELPVSEVRPQWLLDLEAEIQARNLAIAQQNNLSNNAEPTQSTTVNNTLTTPVNSSTQNDAQQDTPNQPQTSSATEVRGIEDTALKTDENTYTQPNQINWIIAIPIIISLLTSGYFLVKLAVKENNN